MAKIEYLYALDKDPLNVEVQNLGLWSTIINSIFPKCSDRKPRDQSFPLAEKDSGLLVGVDPSREDADAESFGIYKIMEIFPL